MKISRMASLDRVSELPSNIVENILMLLPLKDAGRTSILSKKWRYQWATIPDLEFDGSFLSQNLTDSRSTILNICSILSLHQGSILKFKFSIPALQSYIDIGKLIILLTRKGIQDLTLCFLGGQYYVLPFHIFSSLQKLRHLKLQHVIFKSPTFNAFSKLISLELYDVDLALGVSVTSFPVLETFSFISFTIIECLSIDAPRLRSLRLIARARRIHVINSPLLTLLSLDFCWDARVDLIKLFADSPLIQYLHLDYSYLKFLAVYCAENNAPNVPSCLRNLELSEITLTKKDEVLAAFCLIRNSRYLQKLKLKIFQSSRTDFKGVVDCLKQLGHHNISLENLRFVEIECRIVHCAEIELMKIILTISPELETLHIRTSSNRFTPRSRQTLIKLQHLPCASEKATIVFLGLNVERV